MSPRLLWCAVVICRLLVRAARLTFVSTAQPTDIDSEAFIYKQIVITCAFNYFTKQVSFMIESFNTLFSYDSEIKDDTVFI